MPSSSEKNRDFASRSIQLLARATELEERLHEEGVRNRYRGLLEAAAECAEREQSSAEAKSALLRVQVARARDARYGAGQLSRGAQRAPTPADCDDGWMRVEEIARVAEGCAEQARGLALELGTEVALRSAETAELAAREAREIVEARNHAYTFHAEPGFSFGEGWYAAAAAVLGGALLQVEPDKPQTLQAARFLRAAGLGSQIVPYRSRPRSNKHLTAIIAEAFGAGPLRAQQTLRRAFLGEEPISPAIVRWCQRRAGPAVGHKVLVWVRIGTHDSHRNSTPREVRSLCRRVVAAGLVPVLFGDAPPPDLPKETLDLSFAWKEGSLPGARHEAGTAAALRRVEVPTWPDRPARSHHRRYGWACLFWVSPRYI